MTPRIDPTDEKRLTKRFQIRCTPEEYRELEAEAERRGFRRGAHDTGVGLLVRVLFKEALEALEEIAEFENPK